MLIGWRNDSRRLKKWSQLLKDNRNVNFSKSIIRNKMNLLASLLHLLDDNAFTELTSLLLDADEKEISLEFFEIFPALLRKYEEATDDTSRSLILNAILFSKSIVSCKERYIAVMEAFDRFETPSVSHLFAEIIAESLPELNDRVKQEFQNSALLTYLRRCREFATDINDYSLDAFQTANDFLRLFLASSCTNLNLVERLLVEVLTLLPLNDSRQQGLMHKCVSLYRNLEKAMPLTTLIFAASLNGSMSLVPMVYAPKYNFTRSLPALEASLSASVSNVHNISAIITVLKGILTPLEERTLSRDCVSSFINFFGRFLATSEQNSLGHVRKECMKYFEIALRKFEPTAQIIIFRRLISLITTDELQFSMETQVIAWLLDIYRSQLNKYQEFQNELGYIWGQLADIRYERPHESSHFFVALLVLAQFQALNKFNKPLMCSVNAQVLDKLQQQLADWSHLTETDENAKDELQSLPYLQFMMSQTRNFVNNFLHEGF